MILENIKIYSQNIHKNNFIIYTILKMHSLFNIIFIQKLSWTYIHSILSLSNYKGEELVGVPNHPNWITFSRIPTQVYDSPRVIIYINIHILFLHFSLQNNLFSHRNISCVYFFNHGLIYYLINVYSDLSQLTLKYLKNTKVYLNNILIITDDLTLGIIFEILAFHIILLIEILYLILLTLFIWKSPNLLNFSLPSILTIFKTQT